MGKRNGAVNMGTVNTWGKNMDAARGTAMSMTPNDTTQR
jgi:hypothetical protein